MRKNSKLRRITDKELDYIRNNVLKKTDEDIATDLGRPIKFVRRWRSKLGIKKGPRGETEKVIKALTKGEIPKESLRQITKNMNESQRQELFKTQMANTLHYKGLKDAFTDDEIEYYLEEYGALSIQFEDVLATEKRQIDELIKNTLLGKRILKYVKIAENDIMELQSEIERFRLKNDMTQEENQERDFKLTNMVRMMSSAVSAMNREYQEMVKQRNNILEQLNARRKDRIDQIRNGKTTFLGLVERYRDKEIREREGKYLELIRLAKEKKKNQWRKPMMFVDGSQDCILMDEESVLPEREIVLIDDNDSKFLREFNKTNDKKILVIDDDNKRKQFFSEVFKGNQIEYVSNSTEANKILNKLEFDLVCLDYDLGLGQKGTDVVNHILNKGLCKNSKILIQSVNQEGSEKMRIMLSGERELEKSDFNKLLNLYKEIKNA